MLRQSPVVRIGTVLFALTVVAAGVTLPVDASTRRGTSHVAVPRRHARRLRPTATGSVASSTTPAPSSTPAPSAVTPSSVTTAVPSATTLAAGPRPKAYVGLFKDNAVAVFDTATNAVLSKIAVPAGPHGMVMTNDGGRVFVSSDGATVVSVIDTATDRIVDTIDVGGTPHGLALTPDGQTVLVAVFDPGIVSAAWDRTGDRLFLFGTFGTPDQTWTPGTGVSSLPGAEPWQSLAVLSPDGSQVAYTAYLDPIQQQQLRVYVYDVKAGKTRLLTDRQRSQVVFVKDGWVWYLEEAPCGTSDPSCGPWATQPTGKVFAMDLATGTERQVSFATGEEPGTSAGQGLYTFAPGEFWPAA